MVLEVANRYRMDFLAAAQENYHDRNRHAAYRQFVLWQHGRLGAVLYQVVVSGQLETNIQILSDIIPVFCLADLVNVFALLINL